LANNEAYLKEIDKYTKELESLSGQEVVVGIPASKNKNHDGEVTTLAELGAIHEYGAPDVNIPQRSFLRAPLAANVNELFKTLSKDLKFSKIDTKTALGRLGAKGQSIVLKAFNTQNEGTWISLKPKTVSNRKKGKGSGSVKPLIDTGQLRQGITFEVRDLERWVYLIYQKQF